MGQLEAVISAKPPIATDSDAGNITRQGSVVAGMTLLSRISGLIRDIVLSYLFGASQLADMFFIALRVPNFFRRLFAEGAFNQAFVPVMVRYKTEGQIALLGFLAPLSGIFGLCLISFVVVGVWLAYPMAVLFAPGYLDDPELLAQTADLVRITFPYLAFISLTAYAGAVLNAHNRFAVPAVTPVLLNLCLIGAAMLAIGGVSALSDIQTLAWGVIAAGIAQLVFQIPSLMRLGVLVKPTLDTRHAGVRQVGKLMIPAVLAGSVGQINALVNTMLASTLITGSISWLYYADRLLELPVGLVAVALGTVMLPHLSRMAASGDKAAFRATLSWGIGFGLMLGLPAGVALYLLSDALIATLFVSVSGGAMTALDVRMAGYALQMFAVALPGFVLLRILSPAYYAEQDTRTPFRFAAVAVAVNLVASLATYRWFGHVGLAWATALSAWSNVFLLYWGLRRNDTYSVDAALWRVLWKVVVATAVLGGLLFALVGHWDWLAFSGPERIVRMALVTGAGIGAYALVLLALGVRPRHFNHASVSAPD